MKETYQYLPARLAERLRGAFIEARRPVSGLRQSQHHSDILGASVEFAEYRDYYPGAPLNRIDWAVYGRTDRLVLRQAYQEVSARCTVLLDISRSMDYADSGPLRKLEYAKYLAAGMLFVMVNQGDGAGLSTFDHRLRDRFTMVNSAVGLRPALQHLETVTPGPAGDIEATLHELGRTLDRKSFVVVISDLLQDAARILRGLHHLHHKGMDVTVFHIMDPSEVTLPMQGLTELTDMESGKRMTIDLDAIRDRYVQAVNAHIARLQRQCLNLRMDYHFADTRTPVHELILRRSG